MNTTNKFKKGLKMLKIYLKEIRDAFQSKEIKVFQKFYLLYAIIPPIFGFIIG